MGANPDQILVGIEMLKASRILITDCGSTTTKALLFEHQGGSWRLVGSGDAPTTVEAPVADVTVGVVNATREIEETTGIRLFSSTQMQGQNPFLPPGNNGYQESSPRQGIDAFISTSSAGGGLQMAVAGLVREMSAESAQRSALGAGAIVLDVFATDDGREDHDKIQAIRELRPDILLLSGGIDGGAEEQVIDMAETILAAAPEPRFGNTISLPVIYAGNSACAQKVADILATEAHVEIVSNVRPDVLEENLGPAREAIHDLFLSHVMSHSPGYGTLLGWTKLPIIPTPAAVGHMIEVYAKKTNSQVLAVDIGGATTDIFSVCRDLDNALVFNRSVSANLGMSYSIGYVLKEVGVESIMRWLPFTISVQDLRHRLCNKMVRPTTIPSDFTELLIEQAVSREALNLALRHHRALAVGIGGNAEKRGIADMFRQSRHRRELVDMQSLDLIIGAGGVISHAPSRMSALLMLLDGFQPEGITELAVDSVFMLPHLGILAQLDEAASAELFDSACLIPLGVTIAPSFRNINAGRVLARALVNTSSERSPITVDIIAGVITKVQGLEGQECIVEVEPASKRVNVGGGPGKKVSKRCRIGICGLILDGRNRPLEHPRNPSERVFYQQRVFSELGLPYE